MKVKENYDSWSTKKEYFIKTLAETLQSSFGYSVKENYKLQGGLAEMYIAELKLIIEQDYYTLSILDESERKLAFSRKEFGREAYWKAWGYNYLLLSSENKLASNIGIVIREINNLMQ